MNLRFLRRLLCSVFVVWFALFPTLSYASETVTKQTYTYDWREAEREMQEYIEGDSRPYTISPEEIISGGLSLKTSIYLKTTAIGELLATKSYGSFTSPLTGSVTSANKNQVCNSSNSYVYIAYITATDSGEIVDSDTSFKFSLSGLYADTKRLYTPNDGPRADATNSIGEGEISSVRVTLWSKDDAEHENFDVTNDLNITNKYIGIDTEISGVPFDVYKITIDFNMTKDSLYLALPAGAQWYDTAEGYRAYLTMGIHEGTLFLEPEDPSTGLLKGIVEWLKSIKNGITDVADNIISLPSKIWTFIQEGLKMLFIPSEEDISNMHTQWQDLMRDRFGAIYESGDIVHSFSETMSVNSAMVADTGGIITMPAVTANLAGTDFTFGGYDVDLVPDGFQWLVTSIKMLINIVCTILFINALKGKIEVLLR